jgi:N-acyl homoserine lactone hydrolase
MKHSTSSNDVIRDWCRRVTGTARLRIAGAAAVLLLSACGSLQRPSLPATAERLYVIDCGESQATDLSLWTNQASDQGKPYVFSNNCYLIRHRAGWLLWDSGNADRIATMLQGLMNPRRTLTAFMRKPLVDSLREIGVGPRDITHFIMSHSHGDHSGNAGLFAGARIYMQETEFQAINGPDPLRLGIPPANFKDLDRERIQLLQGDHDVFGDGSVVIKSTPGHTPGHQSLFVRLPKSAPVLLSGDFVHLRSNWEAKRAPAMNYDVPQSLRSMEAMEAFLKATGARLWINHDAEQSRAIPKAPAFTE